MLVSFFVVSMAFLMIGAVGQASAAKYKVVFDKARSAKTVVDIRTKGNRIEAFALDSRFQCPNDPRRSGGGVLLGKAFGDDMRPNVPISSSGRFSYKLGSNKHGIALKGVFVKNQIRGAFYIKTDERKDPFGSTCWTGKSQNNPWVRFVAFKK